MKTRYWVLAVALSALVLGLLSLRLLGGRRSGVVQVIQDGAVLREIDLDRVTEPYEFRVESPEGGSNRILVEPGRIRVSEADCPDGLCISQGWLSDQGLPLVCLPHKLIIAPLDPAGADAAAG